MEIRSSADTWFVTSDLEAFEGDRRVFSRSWNHDVPRDHCWAAMPASMIFSTAVALSKTISFQVPVSG